MRMRIRSSCIKCQFFSNMAAGRGYNIGYPTAYPGYSARGYYGGADGYGGYGGAYPQRGVGVDEYGHDYSTGLAGNMGKRLNPEYHYRERGYGYEGTKTAAVDAFENPQAKRRKVDSITICVDYVRGFCSRGARCPKPHVDYVESIDEREILAKVKFCHDFQNKGVCTRHDCKFLHVTRREEDEFLLTGTIPQDVFDRMQDWSRSSVKQDPSSGYGSFGGTPQSGPSPGRGGGGYRGQRPYRGGGRGGGGPRPGGASNSGPNPRRASSGGTGTGHSSSQPVTYGNLCVDFLKGTCTKGENCNLKHVETIDDMNDREGVVSQVFCHDFLNSTCHRPFCKFIHANRQEESFFLENGYFPPSLNTKNKNKLFFSDVCIDFLRNQCVRGQTCQFQHVAKVDAHNERICLSRSIFCHDFQESDCTRPSCKLIHTGKEDEQYFLRTGTLPEYLMAGSKPEIDVSHIQGNVCREFVKNACTRGATCRFYHPTPAELRSILSLQATSESKSGSQASEDIKPNIAAVTTSGDDALRKENEELKSRVQQLERLLADACHCITLAVGDQNPSIATLMKTIAEMAPSSSLANQSEEGGGGERPNGDNGDGAQAATAGSAGLTES